MGSGHGNGYGPGMGGGAGGGLYRVSDAIQEGDVTTNAFDDFFEYALAAPVTIHKNESAMVPFCSRTFLPIMSPCGAKEIRIHCGLCGWRISPSSLSIPGASPSSKTGSLQGKAYSTRFIPEKNAC